MRLQRTFFGLAVPNVLTNLTIPLAGLVDLALLGHLDDVSSLAGVALAGLIFEYLYLSFNFLRMSTTGLVAEAAGSGDLEASASILIRCLALGLCMGGLLTLLQVPIGELAFSLLEGEGDVKAEGRAYFDARIWSAPAVFASYAVSGWLLGRRHVRATLALSVLHNGLNIVLDWVFIYRLGWGAAGAGRATVIAEVTTCLVGLFLIMRYWGNHPAPRLAWLRRDPRALLSIQRDLMIRTLCLITAFALFTNFSAGFGKHILAANATLARLLGSVAWFIDGYAHALETMAGHAKGAGRPAEVLRALKIALTWAAGTIALCILMFLLGGRPLLSLLVDHPPVLDQAEGYIPFLCVTLCFSGFAYILDGLFIGLTRARVLRNAMLLSLATFALFLIPLKISGNPVWLWIGMIAFMVARCATLGSRVRLLARTDLGQGS